jgi:hypothetical protein
MPFGNSTIPLAPGPGTLSGLRSLFERSSRAELHRQLSRLKRDASADWATGGKVVSPEGVAPSTRRLEAGCSSAELRRCESGPCGRSCTRTGSVLSGVSLLLDYAGMIRLRG